MVLISPVREVVLLSLLVRNRPAPPNPVVLISPVKVVVLLSLEFNVRP